MHIRRILAVAALGTLGACNDVLEVNNPNNVNVDALSRPESAANQVNGVLSALTRGATQLIGHASTASDEMVWTGSLEGMSLLNRGFVRDPYNEFLIDATSGMSVARYMANRTVKQLEAFRADNPVMDPTPLALANLYAAVTYDIIATHYDDFVIASDQAIAGPSVGAAKMVTLFDSAEAAATRGIAVAPAANATLRAQLLAMRARARLDRAIWRKLNPSGKTPADPLVNDQGALDDALAALALAPASGELRLPLTVVSGLSYGNCFLPNCTNSRREISFNPALGSYNTTSKELTVALKDPISGAPDPALAAAMTTFITDNLFTSIVVTGTRDARLTAAEVALARGDMTTFAAQINALRAIYQLPAWTGAPGQPSARDILVHERRVNLYLQGRRLNDMYRFGITKPQWVAGSDALACPGSEFPITDNERQANPNVANAQPSCGS